jgi:uncharacterized Zn finger protein
MAGSTKAPPSLTDADIANFIGDPYFERGLHYYLNGHIFDPIRRGQQIEGYCSGSEVEPYHVVVSFNKAGPSGDSCSCPMGGGCKHVVALLLTWAHKAKSFIKRDPTETTLHDKSKEELITLVQAMLKREPGLEVQPQFVVDN